MEIKLATETNFTCDSLRDFRRYQDVKNVYRLINGQMTLIYHPFTEDWDEARRIRKAEEILDGQCITYCAFEGDRVVGEIMLLPALNRGRLVIDSFHVSGDCRRRGIGRALFETAVQVATDRGAHALYASCCSAEETILLFRRGNDPFLYRHGLPSQSRSHPFLRGGGTV